MSRPRTEAGAPSLHGRFLGICDSLPDAIALRLYSGDGHVQTWTYGDLGARAARWAALFGSATSTRGDRRVFIVLPHSVDLYAAFLGALMARAVPAILAHPSPKTPPREYEETLRALFRQAQPAAVVTIATWRAHLSALASSVDGCRVVTVVDLPVSGTDPIAPHSDSDVAFIQYSSGTTGLKKGVAITHRAALWQAAHYGQAIGLTHADRIASWLPLYHDMGLIACAVLPLVTGASVAALSPFDWVARPVSLLEVMTAEGSTLAWMPNFAFNLIARKTTDLDLARLDLRAVRAIVNCSEPVLASSHREFLTRLAGVGLAPSALATSYAMAENTFAVTSGGVGDPLKTLNVSRAALAEGRAVPTTEDDAGAVTLASSGRALADTSIRIVDAAGQPLGDYAIGEIQIASPSLFDAYDASDVSSRTGNWFGTGDLGFQAHGELFVTGRKKDLIIIAGKNIFPQDVEAIANGVSGVVPGRCVAFGVADEARGTDRLVVVAESQVADRHGRAALGRAIRERLAGHDLAVSDVRVVSAGWLRKSTSGKIARGDNRARYLEAVAEVEAASHGTITGAATGLLAEIGAAVRTHLSMPDLADDERLITSGLVDSLGLVDLVIAIENAANIEVPSTLLDVGHFETILTITRLVEHVRAAVTDDGPLQEANRVIQMDDRDKACERFLNTDLPIDCLVLGSSKAKHLWPGVAAEHGRCAFNFWLMSARAEDWYCALRFALDHPKVPLRDVVLVADVEGLSNAAGIDIRLQYSERLKPYLWPSERAGLPVAPATASSGRFQAVTVQFKLGETEAWMLNGAELTVTDRTRVDVGSEGRRATRIDDPHDRDSQYTLRMAGFTALDPTRVSYFRALVALCEQHGIRLLCAISPLHPALDEHLTTSTSYAERLQDFADLVLAIDSPALTFLDTRIPARFDGDDGDFDNGAHMGRANSDQLFRTIFDSADTDIETSPMAPLRSNENHPG